LKFLIRLFIKDSENTSSPKVREQYSMLSGISGIICNLVLFFVKMLSGLATGSMAIFADAFNNLSDCGSSVISVIGARLSNRRPDKDHPFGHGRYEYIASLIVSFIIMLVGFELLKSSWDKILNPVKVSLSPLLICILVLTVFVKLWMFSYNRYMGAKISSQVLYATAKDSLNDSVATSVTIIAAFFAQFTSLPLDGIMGMLVSLFIMYGGFGIAKDTIDLLLGSPAEPETVSEISSLLLSEHEIMGIHDLIVHDYGPGRVMASVHAEVSDKGDVVSIHETIDALEQKIMEEMGINMVIHMDPITTDCETTNSLKICIGEYIKEKSLPFSFHDLRITQGEKNINVIFDLVIPAEFTPEQVKSEKEAITSYIKSLSEKYSVVIHIDTSY